jgi:putative nucleotidyltransferase with HDIG domain
VVSPDLDSYLDLNEDSERITITKRGRQMPEPDSTYLKNLETLVSTRTEQLRRSMSDLEHAQDCILEVYGDALWFKDRATAEHSKRVAAFSIALAPALRLRGEEIREIARGAYLHDIGKLAIPETLLSKTAPFTGDERQIVERHCAWGHQIVSKIKFLSSVADLIHAHHERWDSTGYPNRLKGEMIPKGARVIAVVNAFDSVASDQPYRAARSIEEAIQEIADGSGTQFDPVVVATFLSVPHSTWRDLETQIRQQGNR